jgi:hypothetical protein
VELELVNLADRCKGKLPTVTVAEGAGRPRPSDSAGWTRQAAGEPLISGAAPELECMPGPGTRRRVPNMYHVSESTMDTDNWRDKEHEASPGSRRRDYRHRDLGGATLSTFNALPPCPGRACLIFKCLCSMSLMNEGCD